MTGSGGGASTLVAIGVAPPDFTGPFVQGARGDRFVYLTWGLRSGEESTDWEIIRRAKLRMGAIEWEWIAKARQTGEAFVFQTGEASWYGAKLAGTQRLVNEMTLKDGKIVWELNGLGRPDWTTLPADYKSSGDPSWDATRR